MKRIPNEVYALFGPPPARWKGGRVVARKKQSEFEALKEAGYTAVYAAMKFPMSKGLKRGRLKKGSKVQLVALVRVAAKLYQDAQAARGIMDRWTKDAHEAIYALDVEK
jgi:hypothetical protein